MQVIGQKYSFLLSPGKFLFWACLLSIRLFVMSLPAMPLPADLPDIGIGKSLGKGVETCKNDAPPNSPAKKGGHEDGQVLVRLDFFSSYVWNLHFLNAMYRLT
jgi:hypothetical protein